MVATHYFISLSVIAVPAMSGEVMVQHVAMHEPGWLFLAVRFSKGKLDGVIGVFETEQAARRAVMGRSVPPVGEASAPTYRVQRVRVNAILPLELLHVGNNVD